DVKNLADIWVSSENTNMEMSRPHERSISGVIRFYGAKRKHGRVVEDTIANELKAIVGENANVNPATVIATVAGELERRHSVKKIFHIASVIGQVGVGFTPIPGIGRCVSEALTLADSDDFVAMKLKSILFPLMGTGQARGSLERTAKELIEAAISYLHT